MYPIANGYDTEYLIFWTYFANV